MTPARYCPLALALPAVLACGSGTAAPTPRRAPPRPPLLLRGGDYLDARAGTLRPSGAILVRDGKIVALHPPGSGWRPPAGATEAGDFVVVEGNPLENIRALERPVLVVKGGRSATVF